MDSIFEVLRNKAKNCYGDNAVLSSAMVSCNENKSFYGVAVKFKVDLASMTAITNAMCQAITSGCDTIGEVYAFINQKSECDNWEEILFDQETRALLSEFNVQEVLLYFNDSKKLKYRCEG